MKTPADCSHLTHVYLNDQLQVGILKYIIWVDARDASADGLPKGSVDRTALSQIIDGHMRIKRECEAREHWQQRQRRQQRSS